MSFDPSKHPRKQGPGVKNTGHFAQTTTGRDAVPTAGAFTATPVVLPPTDAELTLARVAQLLRPATDPDLTTALEQAGVSGVDLNAIVGDVHNMLDDQGRYIVHVNPFLTTPPEASEALMRGHVDVYEALCEGLDQAMVAQAVAGEVAPIAAKVPAAADTVTAFLTRAAHLTEHTASAGLLDPIVNEGPLGYSVHPFAVRIDEEYRMSNTGLPVTVADVRGLLTRTRTDGVIRSLDDLVIATHLKGQMALSTGNWRIDPIAVTTDLMDDADRMEDEAVYQALALVYSQGRSQDSGYDQDWTPGAGMRGTVPVRVQAWVQSHGFTDRPFGAWAAAAAA